MAQPVSNLYDWNYVSNLDLHEPQILRTLFAPYGDQGASEYLMIRSFGFETPVAGDTYGHFEEDMYHSTFMQQTGTNVVAGVAGVEMTLTLDTTKIDADGNYYVRVHDVITMTNETQAWVRSITETPGGGFGAGLLVEVIVKPLDNAKNIPAITGGDELGITSGLFSEGSGMPEPAAAGTTYYDNDCQIIKEAIGVTGTELTSESRIAQYNSAGQFQGWYRNGQAGLDYRMLLKINGMFLLGERVDNTGSRAVDPVTSRPYKGSEGLIPFLRRKGNIDTYTVGAYSVTDFDNYGLTLERNFVSSSTPNWMGMGSSLNIEVENELKDYFDDTSINYARQAVNDRLFNGSESMAASVNFKYFTKNLRTYMMSNLTGFSNPVTFGITGYTFNKMGFIIPIEKRKDPKSNNDVPSIGMRYRAMGSLNRRMITATLSGIGASIGQPPVNTIDSANTYALTHMGNEFFGGNRFILIDPV
jgi:hypothetical protein